MIPVLISLFSAAAFPATAETINNSYKSGNLHAENPDPALPVILLYADEECSNDSGLQNLKNALLLRGVLLSSEIAGKKTDKNAELQWRKKNGECGVFFRQDESFFITLFPQSGEDAYRAAASRIVFFISSKMADAHSSSLNLNDYEQDFYPGHEDDLEDAVPEDDSEIVFPDDREDEKSLEVPEKPTEEEISGKQIMPEQEKADTVSLTIPDQSERFDEDHSFSAPSDETDMPGSWRISLVPGMEINQDPGAVPTLSINLLAGITPKIQGVEIGFLANMIQDTMNGVQFVLGFNITGKYMDGVQFAGIANMNLGKTSGVHIAAGANYTAQDMNGIQSALLMNYAGVSSSGIQIAALNYSPEISGAQIGIMNAGATIEGFQLGVINYSRNVDYPIGLVNVVNNEPLRFIMSFSSRRHINVGLTHGGKKLRYLYLAGYQPGGLIPYSIGFGPHLSLFGKRINIGIEALGRQLIGLNPTIMAPAFELRMPVGLKFGSRFEIFLGPSLKALWFNDLLLDYIPPESTLIPDIELDDAYLRILPELYLGIAF